MSSAEKVDTRWVLTDDYAISLAKVTHFARVSNDITRVHFTSFGHVDVNVPLSTLIDQLVLDL